MIILNLVGLIERNDVDKLSKLSTANTFFVRSRQIAIGQMNFTQIKPSHKYLHRTDEI